MDNEKIKGANRAIDDIERMIETAQEFGLDFKERYDNLKKGNRDAKDDILQIRAKAIELKKTHDDDDDVFWGSEEYIDGKSNFIFGTRENINYEYYDKDYIEGVISTYRMVISVLVDALEASRQSDEFWDAVGLLLQRVEKFSGRKPNKLRQEARDFALKQKQELLQKGKSNTEANTIVIYQLERHPIYGNYVKDLGKEALRKLLQIPQPAKEKNGK